MISYRIGSLSGFQELGIKITARLSALMARNASIGRLAQSDPVSSIEGLSQQELTVMGVLGASAIGEVITHWSIKSDVERVGLNGIGLNLGIKRLMKKGFIEERQFQSSYNEVSEGYMLTDSGWNWIDENDSLFVTQSNPEDYRRGNFGQHHDDPIPF